MSNAWVEREIELVKKYVNPEYAAWYDKALAAYRNIDQESDTHFDMLSVVNILGKLANEECLSPIEDTDDVWTLLRRTNYGSSEYVNRRMGSLRKYVDEYGYVTYSDLSRVECIGMIGKPSKLIMSVIDDMFPIEMPYVKEPVIRVACETLAVKPETYGYDTIAIKKAFVNRSGIGDPVPVDINRYFKEVTPAVPVEEKCWVEISEKEWKKAVREYNFNHKKLF